MAWLGLPAPNVSRTRENMNHLMCSVLPYVNLVQSLQFLSVMVQVVYDSTEGFLTLLAKLISHQGHVLLVS